MEELLKHDQEADKSHEQDRVAQLIVDRIASEATTQWFYNPRERKMEKCWDQEGQQEEEACLGQGKRHSGLRFLSRPR